MSLKDYEIDVQISPEGVEDETETFWNSFSIKSRLTPEKLRDSIQNLLVSHYGGSQSE